MLPQLFSDIRVPAAVWTEIMGGEMFDTAKQQLPKTPWLRCVEQDINPPVATWDLGSGESAVLSFALENLGYRALIDDGAGRHCARSLGIPTIGTGGVLVLAKRRGLVASVSEAIQQVREVGLWLADDVVNLLKQQAGE